MIHKLFTTISDSSVTSMEMLHALKRIFIETMHRLLEKYDHILIMKKSYQVLLDCRRNFEVQASYQEEKRIAELLAEERIQKDNQALNENQSPQEMRIQDLESDSSRFHPNTIHTPVSQNVEPKDSLIMGDGHINTTPETETISVETLVSNPTDVPSFSDDWILRGIESDRDSGEDTTSIDALPLDDSMILSEYESFTFDDEPVMAEVNVFDEINTSELSYPGIGENVILDEEEDTFTFTIRSFLPFVTYPEVLPTSYSTGSEDKKFNPGILDVFDPLHPPLMDFHVTKAFSRFSGFWKTHGSILWKDKAIPTIFIDDLQSSLHKDGNLLSLSLSRLTSYF
ncbi:hypothetical protein Tco_1243993 [Tanacetum coccineum]